jgi:hypothetical protein
MVTHDQMFRSVEQVVHTHAHRIDGEPTLVGPTEDAVGCDETEGLVAEVEMQVYTSASTPRSQFGAPTQL